MTKFAIKAALAFVCVLFAVSGSVGREYYVYTPHPATPGESKTSGDGLLVEEVPVQKGDTLYGLSHRFSGRGSYYPQILLFNNIENPNMIYAGDKIRVPVSSVSQDSAKQVKPVSNAAGRKKKKSGSSAKHAAEIQKKSSKTQMDNKKAQPRPQALNQTKPAQPVAASAPPATRRAASVTELNLSDLKRLDDTKAKIADKKIKTAGKGVKKEGKVPLQASVPAKRRKVDLGKEEKVAVQEKTEPAQKASSEQKLFDRALNAYRQDNCRGALELLDRFVADYPGSSLAADARLYRAECYLKMSSQ